MKAAARDAAARYRQTDKYRATYDTWLKKRRGSSTSFREFLAELTLDSAASIVVVAGPNGAGKTTAAPFLLRDALGVREYVNADPIAAGLSAFAPESVAIAAGRVMLARIDELARQRISFGFETTLASRSFAPWLRLRLADGYAVHLVFLWLASRSWRSPAWLGGWSW